MSPAMRRTTMACLLLASLYGVARAAEPAAKTDLADLERRVEMERKTLALLAEQDLAGLKKQATAISELKFADRQALPVRIRPSAVEFRFRGVFPGPAISNIEYVISKAGDKDHETMLAVNPAELKRLHELRDALNKLVADGYVIRLDVRMLWNDQGRTHSEDLEDILALAPDKDRDSFGRKLLIDESGMGAFNIIHDPLSLPAGRQSAEVHVTVRVSQK